MTGFGGLIESTGLVKKVALQRLGNYSNSLSMTSGLDLCIRIAAHSDVAVLRDPLVLYRLSDGQFHKQEDVLLKEMKIMSTKFGKDSKDIERLQQLHAAYHFWLKCKNHGIFFFLVGVLKSILYFQKPRLVMLYFLVSRNFLAICRGMIQQKVIQNLIQTSTKINNSSI